MPPPPDEAPMIFTSVGPQKTSRCT